MALDLTIDSSAWICAALNVLLNLQFDVKDGQHTIAEAVAGLKPDLSEDSNNEEKTVYTDYYQAMRRMLEASKVLGSLVIDKQSWQMGYHRDGIQAAVFTGKAGCFVALRGTGPGEWNDNAVALSGRPQVNTYYQYNKKGCAVDARICEEYVSAQQAQALDYFNRVAAELGWKTPGSILLTGHSKGGNKALFITLRSPLVKACYAFCGQGFAPEAVEQFERELGAAEYSARCAKMYLICSYNDFVNPLGIQVIPSENVARLDTMKINYLRQYHEIAAIIGADGGLMPEREIGEISTAVAGIWRELKDSPRREKISMVAMTLVGGRYGNGMPVNGEYISSRLSLYSGGSAAVGMAIKTLAGLLIQSGVNVVPEEDRNRISGVYDRYVKSRTEAVKGSSFGRLVGRMVERLRERRKEPQPLKIGSDEPCFKVNPNSLWSGAAQLAETQCHLKTAREQAAGQKAHLANLAERLKNQEDQLRRIEEHLTDTADLFIKTDRELAQVASFVFALPAHGGLAELYPKQQKQIEPAIQKSCGEPLGEQIIAIAEEILEAASRITRDNERINCARCVEELLGISSTLHHLARKNLI